MSDVFLRQGCTQLSIPSIGNRQTAISANQKYNAFKRQHMDDENRQTHNLLWAPTPFYAWISTLLRSHRPRASSGTACYLNKQIRLVISIIEKYNHPRNAGSRIRRTRFLNAWVRQHTDIVLPQTPCVGITHTANTTTYPYQPSIATFLRAKNIYNLFCGPSAKAKRLGTSGRVAIAMLSPCISSQNACPALRRSASMRLWIQLSSYKSQTRCERCVEVQVSSCASCKRNEKREVTSVEPDRLII